MKIVAKHIAEARRAAREAQQRAAEQTSPAPSLPKAIVRESPVSEEQPSATAVPQVKAGAPVPDEELPGAAPERREPRRAGEAKRVSRPKKQPTGDYETGYCRPPVEHRFDGSRAGPGRPKNSISQDTIARKHLNNRRQVTVEGKLVKVAHRELVYMQRLNAAVTGKDRHAMNYILADALRLFPDEQVSESGSAAGAPLTDTSQAILDMFAEEIRQEQREGQSSP